MAAMHYLGAVLVLLLVTALGVYSGMRVKSSQDFASAGRKAGRGIVAGSIIGTLVGGASTIGTAQLAFVFGFSAWWFTLGGGLACLVLALVYVKPVYESGVGTMPQILSKEYGKKVATTALVLTSLGSFLSIVSQVLASTALVTSVSALAPWLATAISVFLMIVYVAFGGLWGAGLVGVAKTVLICVGVGTCGIMTLYMDGGLAAITKALPAERYFDPLARGAAVDLGAGLSLVLGVITTQAYLQAFVAAKTLRVAREGLLVGAILVPLIGLPGVLVGLYMKTHAPEIDAASALPLFILNHIPPLFGGMILATLLVTVVGTAAGVALGLSAMFCQDIYRVYFRPDADDSRLLRVSRITLASVLLAAGLVSAGNLGSFILGWSFMSMGLRGAVAFGVLTCAIFFPGRVSSRYAMWSMIAGPIFILVGKAWFGKMFDPLFLGVGASLLLLAVGAISHGKRDV